MKTLILLVLIVLCVGSCYVVSPDKLDELRSQLQHPGSCGSIGWWYRVACVSVDDLYVFSSIEDASNHCPERVEGVTPTLQRVK